MDRNLRSHGLMRLSLEWVLTTPLCPLSVAKERRGERDREKRKAKLARVCGNCMKSKTGEVSFTFAVNLVIVKIGGQHSQYTASLPSLPTV